MRRFTLIVLSVLALAAGVSSTNAEEPSNGPALAEAVKKAIETKDAAALDKLVYWDGASDGGKEFFKALLETAMEIKVTGVEVTPLPPDKTGPPTTLPVTHLVRITGAEGEGPTRQMLPVGEKDGKLYITASKDAPGGMR